MTLFGRLTGRRKGDITPEEMPANVLDVMDHTVRFMSGLKALGGFGYILFGAGFVLIVTLVFVVTYVAAEITAWLLPLSVVLVSLGVILVIVERVMAFRIAQMKLDMIVSVTKEIVTRAIPADGRMDTSVMRTINQDVLAPIWGLWIPDSRNSETRDTYPS
jgi:hypothetical protein